MIHHYLNAVKSRTVDYIYKRKGWTTNRKIVVIESDDWGSIRMPSLATLNTLLKRGVKLFPELGLDRFDTLASNDDLELLMDVLYSVKDKNNKPAKITLNCIMTNPDFIKIKESGFGEYHYELFTDTLMRYPNHNNSFELLKEGINKNVFKPQFHGREHLNVQMWLHALIKDFPGVRLAFDYHVFCNHIDKKFDSRVKFLEAYNIKHFNEYSFIKNSIIEGLNLFEKIFGYKSQSFIAPNYVWDDKVEEYAFTNGIKYIQGGVTQRNPIYETNKSKKHSKYHYLGEINRLGQVYLIRNCVFEPSHNKKLNSYKCLKDIETMFNLNKPAVICSHRLNYIGELDKKNRDEGLKELSLLLKQIVKKYPMVEFMSSDQLGTLISQPSKGI
jgi:hypothetical protein